MVLILVMVHMIKILIEIKKKFKKIIKMMILKIIIINKINI